MHDFVRETWFGLLVEKTAPGLLSAFARRFRSMTRAAMLGTIAAGIFVLGSGAGWFAHGYLSGTEAQKPCREEVVSVDGARGPVSCSHADQVGELKDGYLICKCKKK